MRNRPDAFVIPIFRVLMVVDGVVYAILWTSSKKHTAETSCENVEQSAELLAGNTKNFCLFQERQWANSAGKGYFYIDW